MSSMSNLTFLRNWVFLFCCREVVIILNYIETTATHTSSKVMILLMKLGVISFQKIISPQAGDNTTKTPESEKIFRRNCKQNPKHKTRDKPLLLLKKSKILVFFAKKPSKNKQKNKTNQCDNVSDLSLKSAHTQTYEYHSEALLCCLHMAAS